MAADPMLSILVAYACFAQLAFAQVGSSDGTSESSEQRTSVEPARLTAQEWVDLEAKLDANPYYLLTLDRPHALALIGGGIEARPDGPWAEMGNMICMVDGEHRRQLKGGARVAAYQESVQCFQGFYAVARSRHHAPESEASRRGVETLQEGLAEAAVEAGLSKLAASLATELLERNTDPRRPTHGRIVHNANQVLGRVALHAGNLEAAKRCLLAAGRTPGGPGLAGYGPQFFLARELLEHGEAGIVLEYLNLVSHPPQDTYSGLHDFEGWKKEIREGRIPKSIEWH